jgi:hypothetical protein
VDSAVIEQFPVPSAQLYTETRGAGPLLLLLLGVGGNGDPALFSGVADRLAGVFATYETSGLWPAMAQFGRVVGLGRPTAPPPGADSAAGIAAMRPRATPSIRATSRPGSARCSARIYKSAGPAHRHPRSP